MSGHRAGRENVFAVCDVLPSENLRKKPGGWAESEAEREGRRSEVGNQGRKSEVRGRFAKAEILKAESGNAIIVKCVKTLNRNACAEMIGKMKAK